MEDESQTFGVQIESNYAKVVMKEEVSKLLDVETICPNSIVIGLVQYR